jgi:hypothetical protein
MIWIELVKGHGLMSGFLLSIMDIRIFLPDRERETVKILHFILVDTGEAITKQKKRCEESFPHFVVFKQNKFRFVINILWHICSRQEPLSQQRQPLLGKSSTKTPVAR